MTNKKLTPVTFSDESVEKNEQVGVKPVNRLAPVDPGSGSGSTSGLGDGTVHGTVSSIYGCEWSVNGNFSWYADYTYRTWVEDDGFRYYSLELRIDLVNVQFSFNGLPYICDNTTFTPFPAVVSLPSIGCSQPNLITENEETLCTFKYTLSPVKVYVEKTQRKEDEEPEVELLTEDIAANMDVFFYVTPNFCTNQKPTISVRSCVVY